MAVHVQTKSTRNISSWNQQIKIWNRCSAYTIGSGALKFSMFVASFLDLVTECLCSNGHWVFFFSLYCCMSSLTGSFHPAVLTISEETFVRLGSIWLSLKNIKYALLPLLKWHTASKKANLIVNRLAYVSLSGNNACITSGVFFFFFAKKFITLYLKIHIGSVLEH